LLVVAVVGHKELVAVLEVAVLVVFFLVQHL
jgi:hypothetical protein